MQKTNRMTTRSSKWQNKSESHVKTRKNKIGKNIKFTFYFCIGIQRALIDIHWLVKLNNLQNVNKNRTNNTTKSPNKQTVNNQKQCLNAWITSAGRYCFVFCPLPTSRDLYIFVSLVSIKVKPLRREQKRSPLSKRPYIIALTALLGSVRVVFVQKQ